MGFSIKFKTHSIGELTSTNLSPLFLFDLWFVSELSCLKLCLFL